MRTFLLTSLRLFTLLKLSGFALVSQAQNFGAPTTYPTLANGAATGQVRTGDVNNDGRLDIVTTNLTSSQFNILMGQATGFGTASYRFGGCGAPTCVELADINADGWLDLVSGFRGQALLGFVPGGPNGFNASPGYCYGYGATVGSELTSIAVGDINNDGFPDVIGGDLFSDTVIVWTGRANGLGSSRRYCTTAGGNPQCVALADLNADGRLDLIAANRAGTQISVRQGQAGGFGPATLFAAGGSAGAFTNLVVEDFNGDGYLDLAASKPSSNTVELFVGQSGVGFGPPTAYVVGNGTQPSGLAAGALNGDWYADLVAPNNAAQVSVWNGQPLGLGAGTTYPGGNSGNASDVALGDVNNDGQLDVVTFQPSTSTVSVLLNASTVPTLLRLSIPAGAPGAVISLAGSNLRGALAVSFAGSSSNIVSTGFAVNAAGTQLTGVVVPAGAQTGLVSVTTSHGTFTSAVSFRVTTALSSRPVNSLAYTSLFPNPAHDRATVQLPPGAGPATLTVLDALGRPVRILTSPNSKTELDLTGLAAGLYAVHVSAGGSTVTQRLVVE